MPDERKESALGFLQRALDWLAQQGVTVERVMTDNGSAYRSRDFRAAVAAARPKHKRTRPYTSRTNPRPSGLSKPACVSGPMPGLT
jgi:Integrase core domain